jgi:hypothetical protein
MPPKADAMKVKTAFDRESTKGITVTDMLRVFPGAKVVSVTGPRSCRPCSRDHVPTWRRGGKMIEVTLADGTVTSMCHYCGRRAERNGR